MIRKNITGLIMALTLGVAAPALAASDKPNEPELWRSYNGVSWDAAGSNTPDATSYQAPIAGLHFAKNGTAFVSVPRWINPAVPATLNRLSTAEGKGPAALTAFPSAKWNAAGGPPAQTLRNVLGFYVDNTNNWLWALDMGFVAGEAQAPEGGQKIVIFDLTTGEPVRTVVLDTVADRKGSFLNDIAVDEKARIAYVSDSGFRSAPDNKTGIIVYDFKADSARRLLHQDPSVQIKKDIRVTSHGEAVWEGQPILIGINGIALSKDGDTLYWTVTTGDALHAVSTEKLKDVSVSAADLSASVKTVARLDFGTDGIMVGDDGAVLITDVAHNGITRVDAATGATRLAVAGEGVFWPDTVTRGEGNSGYFTSSNANNHFAGTVKPGGELSNIWRFPLSAR
ncbi:SMP-30/gluconolactonase/LRE family protein [Agrobacterium sp. MOPV5]|uniref:L-dopachrome tautomerase-related protein n=1 Tax=Agrobacterium leguminum TaxID=2792015 RepID=UPI0018C28EF5|nr:L-dopachrome tautomerase-related protein [Agrobacterium leguminum]MBG0510839.1 SMP-30/gluconolactonase/LRE family protein [Agrobacterium leguminum]